MDAAVSPHSRRRVENSLDNKEELMEEPSDRTKGGEYNDAKHAKGSDSGHFLLLPNDRQPILQMVAYPQGTVNSGRNEQPATRPPMDNIQLFVAISWAEEKRDDRVLGGEEEDYGELCQRQKTWLKASDLLPQTRDNTDAPPRLGFEINSESFVRHTNTATR